jgi:hypothetical protein
MRITSQKGLSDEFMGRAVKFYLRIKSFKKQQNKTLWILAQWYGRVYSLALTERLQRNVSGKRHPVGTCHAPLSLVPVNPYLLDSTTNHFIKCSLYKERNCWEWWHVVAHGGRSRWISVSSRLGWSIR